MFYYVRILFSFPEDWHHWKPKKVSLCSFKDPDKNTKRNSSPEAQPCTSCSLVWLVMKLFTQFLPVHRHSHLFFSGIQAMLQQLDPFPVPADDTFVARYYTYLHYRNRVLFRPWKFKQCLLQKRHSIENHTEFCQPVKCCSSDIIDIPRPT